MHMASWPAVGVLTVAVVLLIHWQQQRRDTAHQEAAETAAQQAELRSKERADSAVTLSGVAVPGSLQWRMYGDEIGMGICEGKFLLAPAGAAGAEPTRVHWTRCDLPDDLSSELQRVFSPLREAQPVSVTVRGHWAGASSFEALGLVLQP